MISIRLDCSEVTVTRLGLTRIYKAASDASRNRLICLGKKYNFIATETDEAMFIVGGESDLDGYVYPGHVQWYLDNEWRLEEQTPDPQAQSGGDRLSQDKG